MNPASKQDQNIVSSWPIVVYVIVISLAADAAFFISKAGSLGWKGTAVAVASAALLTGGILFTSLQMRKLPR